MYITDALKAIAHNSSLLLGGSGVELNMRYAEIISAGATKEEPKETADEIKARITSGLNAIAEKTLSK